MGQFAFLTFAIVLLVAVISPGPAIAALVARIMARGTEGIAAFCAGLVLGDLIWLSCAMFALAALASLFQPLFQVVKYCGAAYLLFLAFRLWTDSGAPVAAEPVRGRGFRLFGAALLLSMGNPKIMLFYLALMPTLIDLTQLTFVDMAELAGIVAVGCWRDTCCSPHRRAGCLLRRARSRQSTGPQAWQWPEPRQRSSPVTERRYGKCSRTGSTPLPCNASKNSAPGTASKNTSASANVISTRGGRMVNVSSSCHSEGFGKKRGTRAM